MAGMNENHPPTLGELYPDLTESELAQAHDALEHYLTLVLRIFERPEASSYPHPDSGSREPGTLSCTPPT